jgi:hypothetical protein
MRSPERTRNVLEQLASIASGLGRVAVMGRYGSDAFGRRLIADGEMRAGAAEEDPPPRWRIERFVHGQTTGTRERRCRRDDTVRRVTPRPACAFAGEATQRGF